MARKRAEEAGRIAPLLLSRFRGSANAGRGRTCAVAATISDVMAMISIFLDDGIFGIPSLRSRVATSYKESVDFP